ncbi:FecR family protein [Mucilaginibacter sp.]|jgi:ferric-dicitrate binding protein FerR (iron transport regulator)|uniref:FecR family protein n=1 Tax=Mucilaginibacter sp. TaxID=1882438 RepID=UPI00356A7246
MTQSDKRLAYLFSLYFSHKATEQEINELCTLTDLIVDDEQLTLLLQKAWDEFQLRNLYFDDATSKQIFNNVLGSRVKEDISVKRLYWSNFSARNLAIAASIIAMLGVGLYFFRAKSSYILPDQVNIEHQNHDALPGGNNAVLTLADGSRIVLNKAKNGTLVKVGNIKVNKTADGQLVYSINGAGNEQRSEFNTISTPKGGQYQVVLADGTKVWLNAASSIKYPTMFSGRKRQVEILGEAYFEVAKNPKVPFVVKIGQTEIKVLGTHFNVMAYNDESQLKATLIEGAVQISNGSSTGLLKPGDQAVVNNKNFHLAILHDVDIDRDIAWKDGSFDFKNADVQQIMRQVSRWYDIDVHYEGKIPNKVFTGSISRSVNLSEVLDIFHYSGLRFKIEGKRITIQS